MTALPENYIHEQVRQALEEDVGAGDLTAELIPESIQMKAVVISRQPAVIAGAAWVNEVFRQIDNAVTLNWFCHDSDRVNTDEVLFEISGTARSLLTGERTALNFLQTLSAVASRTRLYVDAVAGTGVNILDTRKTIPGLRLAQKYAVTCGGGVNHRIGLYDAVLLKENHIAAAGSVALALEGARQLAGQGVDVEIEVESLDEMQQALEAGATHMLLDNFGMDELRKAVDINAGRARLEASGNVTLDTVRSIAETGVNDISIGELTKHIDAVDLSMRFE